MAHRRIDRLDIIDAETLERLKNNGITTVRDLFHVSSFQIMVIADINLIEAESIISKVSKKILSNPRTALDIYQERQTKKNFLSTRISSLDKAMKGGLLIGCINEICGPPGVGKTQFCLNCSLQTLMENYSPVIGQQASSGVKGVVYIDTELKFDARRLKQMAVENYPVFFSYEVRNDAAHQIDNLLECVKIKRPMSTKELEDEISKLQNEVISQNIGLIVIDSIAALARKENLNEKDKGQFFIQQASQLKKIAEFCNCVVLVTNQVTPIRGDQRSINTALGDAFFDELGGIYYPTLGPTWHHCVSVRLAMTQKEQQQKEQIEQTQQWRNIAVVKSPLSGQIQIPCVISASGIN